MQTWIQSNSLIVEAERTSDDDPEWRPDMKGGF